MKTIRILICGCGGVGKEFLQLIADRKKEIEQKYNLSFIILAAVDYQGAAICDSDEGLPVSDLVDFLKQGRQVQVFPEYGRENMTGVQVINEIKADVMVEATPTDLVDGGSGKDHIFTAIDKRMEIVSANKGPFVLFYDEIVKKAKANNCGLHISAATAAALPTLDVGLTCLAGSHIKSAEGILNGTTNYILSQMRDKKTAYSDALKQAQELGIAETDPSYDVEGKDSANKTILIANGIFNKTFGLNDIEVEGITGVTPENIVAATNDGKIIKLIGTAEMIGSDIKLSVKPKYLNQDHPLASVNGSEKAITYMTDTMGSITVMGGKSSPVGAAAALLKDLINAFK